MTQVSYHYAFPTIVAKREKKNPLNGKIFPAVNFSLVRGEKFVRVNIDKAVRTTRRSQ
jgi:hypothetical protein